MAIKFQISNFKFQISNWKIVVLVLIVLLAAILRFYKLSNNPPGLYWDEAVIGYDSYSILKTSKDHHGNFLPLFFESFGDWKLPVYHYLVVPSISIFGLNEFAVRFPSALLGSFSVLFFFLIVNHLTKNLTLSLFCSFFLAISPWHIQFSRGGFEANAGLSFVTFGLYFFLKAQNQSKSTLLSLSFLFFILSMYTYHAYRIFTPLFLFVLTIIYFRNLKKNIAKLIIPAVLLTVLIIPLLIFTLSSKGRARATTQSIFKKSDFEIAKLDYDQKSKKPLRFLSKYLYNQPTYYSYQALNSYLDHFSPVFLFFRGDQVGRHSQVDMGQIYLFEALLAVISIFALRKLDQKIKIIMISWLLLAPIPAMIVAGSPHALRSLTMSIPLAFLSGLGIYYFFSQKKLYLFIKLLLLLVIIYSFLTYLHLLFVHYPRKFAADWQDGYKQMVEQVKKYQDYFDKVYITNTDQVPYIYILFYQMYDPQKFINQKGTRVAFDEYVFVPDDFNIYDKGRVLYVAPSWKKVDGIWLAAVDDSTGRHLYSLWSINAKN